MIEFYVTLAIAVVLSILFLAMWRPQKFLLDFFLKSLATISVIALCAVTLYETGLDVTGILLIVGLAFCMFGDLGLALREFKLQDGDKESEIITMGELAFGIAQIFFIVMLALLSDAIALYGLIVGAAFAVGMLVLKKPMKLDFGKCLVPSLIYAFLLASNVGGSLIWMIVGGATLTQILLFAGFACFIISDLILSKIYFGGNRQVWVQQVNYVFYYAAIILLAMSFISF